MVDYLWHDLVGNMGVVIIVGTYLFVQLGRMDVQAWRYTLLNILGAVFILISLYHNFNLSAFIIEIAWLVISCVGVIRLINLRSGEDHLPTDQGV
jgi:uncharacterized membrane protein YoaT (DUF817 family)